ncbi:MAG: T9SS type A sorting domain-containing protein [Saprospiraceae bacterium]
MRYKIFIILLLSLITTPSLLAQTDHAWIGTGKVRAHITPTGIHRDSEGGFLLESGIPGQPAKNLLSHITPWVGGIDPGNNLTLACEMGDPLVSDWQAGFRGVPNSGKVWKVTAEQIAVHVNDYQDNGVIDNPIPEIFAWPGQGNPFSTFYNGFSMDSIFPPNRPYFYDNGGIIGKYNPESGDYPVGPNLGSSPFFPSEFVFAPFFDNGENKLTDATGTDLDGQLSAFTLNCQEQDFLKNTIFFEFGRYRNSGVDRLDSLHWGIYADFEIGNPNDDYLGCVIEQDREMVYCYNSDSLNDNIIGTNPPVLALMSLAGPQGIDGNFIQMTNFTMFSDEFSPGAQPPSAPLEFYNYLTGTWRDGSPITSGGIGYNPGISSTPEKVIFPDNPTDPNGWSELAENNVLGNRKCVVSYGPSVLYPHYISFPLKFALTVTDKVGLTQQLQHLTEMRDLQQYVYKGCWDCPNLLDTLCFAPVSAKEIARIIRIAPNPTQDFVSMETPGIDIHNIILYTALGQRVSIDPPQFVKEQEVMVSLKNLPSGIYFIQWFSRDGKRGCEKVVKN